MASNTAHPLANKGKGTGTHASGSQGANSRTQTGNRGAQTANTIELITKKPEGDGKSGEKTLTTCPYFDKCHVMWAGNPSYDTSPHNGAPGLSRTKDFLSISKQAGGGSKALPAPSPLQGGVPEAEGALQEVVADGVNVLLEVISHLDMLIIIPINSPDNHISPSLLTPHFLPSVPTDVTHILCT
ncbi:hypothetical protein HYDPIDRAFT_23749 [Hydnomerulius pinastri MD-312]|nr:hypothetical protein HYDPIDRAFT_23749 [Hydnomerulius pinastri MD-312]